MKTTDILTALLERLDTLVLSPVIPITWPGLPKTPPSNGMWLETGYFPNEATDLTWDEIPHQEIVGFFQISVYWRPGTATGQSSQVKASLIADDVIAHFPKGLAISDVMVRKKPWQSPAVNLEGKSYIPITIPYRGIV